MGYEQTMVMSSFGACLENESWRFDDESELDIVRARVYYTLGCIAPASLLAIAAAFNQTALIGFLWWIVVACVLVSSPLLVALWHQVTWEMLGVEPHFPTGSIAASAFTPSQATESQTQSRRYYGNEQTSVWREWQIHHTCYPASSKSAQDSPPILLIHGFGGSIGHWRQNMPALAKSHDVYALDLLGFGASEKPETEYSIQLWVDQIYDFWRSHIQVPVVLVGNSIGSITCLTAAANHPEMVKGVAMISLPDCSLQEELMPAFVRPLAEQLRCFLTSPWILSPLFYLLRQPWIVRRWARLAYAYQESITDELLEILTQPAKDRGSAKAFCAILKAMLSPQFSPNIRSILGKLQMPSLLLWGKQDRMIPITLAWRFLACNPALQLIELEDAGHCAHDECPEQVNFELLNWIQVQGLGLCSDCDRANQLEESVLCGYA